MFFYILIVTVIAAALIIGASDARELENVSPKRRIKEFFSSSGLITVLGGIVIVVVMIFTALVVFAFPGENKLVKSISYNVAPASKIEVDNDTITFHYLDAAGTLQQFHEDFDTIDFKNNSKSQVEVQEVDVSYPLFIPWSPIHDIHVIVK